MGLFADLGRLARARCAAVVLTAALPVLPAYVLAGGVVYLASARSEAQLGAPTKGEEVVHGQRELGERVARGDRPSDSAADTRRDVLRGDGEPSRVRPSSFSLAFLAGLATAFGLLTAGLFLAQAALLPVVAGCGRPSEAWAIVATRFRPLLGTIALAVVLIGVGLAFFAVPGVVLALGFSLAAPVVLAEGSAGSAALQRSWRLMRWAWRTQLGIVLVGAVTTVGIRWVLGKYWPVHGLAAHVALNAVVCALVLPFPIAASAILYLRARRQLDGMDPDELCRSIRRLSAPT